MKRLSAAFTDVIHHDLLCCVHEALLKYQNCLRNGASIETPAAWIYTTSKNLVLKFLQDEQRRRSLFITMPHEDVERIADTAPTTFAGSYEALDRLAKVSQNAQALPARLRRLLKVLIHTQSIRPDKERRKRRGRERKSAAPSASKIADVYRSIYGETPSVSTIARGLEELRASLRC